MPTAGLSLVGFMDQLQAIHHLSNACIPHPNQDLNVEWTTARGNLGQPTPSAGSPDIQPIPASCQAHIAQLQLQPAFQPGSPLHGVAFQMVEIDPLLAYQFTVDVTRSNHHCGTLAAPPTEQQLMECCLPLGHVQEPINTFPGVASMILKAKSLNVRAFDRGLFNGEFIGISFGVSAPYVHVVRHNGRCYLHNGYHRAYGIRVAGGTHIACVFRDVADHAAVGINPGTFQPILLESANPPTLAHFTQGRAHSIQLRSHSRFLHVSWAEYVLPDE